ncbi:MAG: prepilin-type N-terminal cleavage/methylation domain-containing protein [Vulcanimicrobiota bacterium]
MRRAFTLVELLVVLAVIVTLAGPLFAALCTTLNEHRIATVQADVRAESRALVARLHGRLALPGKHRADADCHGLNFADGSHLRWQDQKLLLRDRHGEHSLTPYPVREFAVVKRHGQTWLTLELEYLACRQRLPYRYSGATP